MGPESAESLILRLSRMMIRLVETKQKEAHIVSKAPNWSPSQKEGESEGGERTYAKKLVEIVGRIAKLNNGICSAGRNKDILRALDLYREEVNEKTLCFMKEIYSVLCQPLRAGQDNMPIQN